MWQRMRFVILLLCCCSAVSWGQEAPVPHLSQPAPGLEESSMKPSLLWKIADEALSEIEKSLDWKEEPLERLSAILPELCRRSIALEQSVSGLEQRFASLEAFLIDYEKRMIEVKEREKKLILEIRLWRVIGITGILGTAGSLVYILVSR